MARAGETRPNLQLMALTYRIIQAGPGRKAIQCVICGMASYNTGDLDNLYCANCKMSHDELLQKIPVFDCPECHRRVQVDEHGACPHEKRYRSFLLTA